MDSMEGMGDGFDQEELLSLLEAYEKSGKRFGDVPEGLQELLDNVKKRKGQPVAETESEEIVPTPGFVVKTADAEGGKAFINVCSSPSVPAPGNWNSATVPDHVLKALEAAKDVQELADQHFEALRLPMSVGDVRTETDKKGEPCKAVDCVVNPGVLTLASTHRPFKVFLIQLTLDQVAAKHKLQLDAKFKLPKMSYKGVQVASQRIRKDPKQLVTDLGEVPEQPSFPLIAGRPKGSSCSKGAGGVGQEQRRAPPVGTLATSSGRARAAAVAGVGSGAAGRGSTTGAVTAADETGVLQHRVQYEGRPVRQVLVEVQLPKPSLSGSSTGGSSSSSTWSCSSICTSVAGRELRVEAEGCQALTVQLPFAVGGGGEGAQVELDAAGGRLSVTLPYLPLQQYVEALREAAPVRYGALPVDHAAYLELDD